MAASRPTTSHEPRWVARLRGYGPVLRKHLYLDDVMLQDLHEDRVISEDEKIELTNCETKLRVNTLLAILESKMEAFVDMFFTYLLQKGSAELQKALKIEPPKKTKKDEKQKKVVEELKEKRKSEKGDKARPQTREPKPKQFTYVPPPSRKISSSSFPTKAKLKSKPDTKEQKKIVSTSIDERLKKREELRGKATRGKPQEVVIYLNFSSVDGDEETEKELYTKAWKLLNAGTVKGDQLLPLHGSRILKFSEGSIACHVQTDTVTGLYDVGDYVIERQFSENGQKLLMPDVPALAPAEARIDENTFYPARAALLDEKEELRRKLNDVFRRDEASQPWVNGNWVIDTDWAHHCKNFLLGNEDQSPGEACFSRFENPTIPYEEISSYTTDQVENIRSLVGFASDFLYFEIDQRRLLSQVLQSGNFIVSQFVAIRFHIVEEREQEQLSGDQLELEGGEENRETTSVVSETVDKWVNLDTPLKEVISHAATFDADAVFDCDGEELPLDLSLRDWSLTTRAFGLSVYKA